MKKFTKLGLFLTMIATISICLVACGSTTSQEDYLDTEYTSNPSDPASIDPYYLKNADNKSVTFGDEEFEIFGTLSIPESVNENEKFPAVILVGGSGPVDRDETIGPNKMFRDIAQGLINQRIAVLRYDKRTLTHQSKFSQEPETYKNLTVKDEIITDAVYGVSLLAQNQQIDRNSIFIIGHSLGGNQAPNIADECNRTFPVAGMIIMAGNITELQDLMYDQTTYLAELDGDITTAEENSIKMIKEARDYINSPNFNENSDYKKSLQVYPPYWLSLKGYDPTKLAVELNLPILVMQGSRDYQVPQTEFEKWKSGLAPLEDKAEFQLFEVNHIFMTGYGKPNPQEYLTPNNVQKEIVDSIATFIKKHSDN